MKQSLQHTSTLSKRLILITLACTIVISGGAAVLAQSDSDVQAEPFWSEGNQKIELGQGLVNAGEKNLKNGRGLVREGEEKISTASKLIRENRTKYGELLEALTPSKGVSAQLSELHDEFNLYISDLADGNQMVEEGSELIRKGYEQVKNGRKSIHAGQEKIKKSKRVLRFKLMLPDSKDGLN